MLQSWTSILVRFHIERSSRRVHNAWNPTNNNPGKLYILIFNNYIDNKVQLKISIAISTKIKFQQEQLYCRN